MCNEKPCCEHPRKKVMDPKKRSPEQIAECHPNPESILVLNRLQQNFVETSLTFLKVNKGPYE